MKAAVLTRIGENAREADRLNTNKGYQVQKVEIVYIFVAQSPMSTSVASLC